MSEAPQVDILEASKEKFINLMSELDDGQFHSFEQFVQTALRTYTRKKNFFFFFIFFQIKTDSLTCNFLEEYHGQIHNHHGEETENMDTEEEHDGSYQPVSEAKMMRLGRMIKDLRNRVPISAEAPGEKTTIPNTPDVSICKLPQRKKRI